MNSFAQFIGYLAMYLAGLAACGYGGFFATLLYRDKFVSGSEGLSDMAIGFAVGGALAVLYLGAGVVWLAVT